MRQKTEVIAKECRNAIATSSFNKEKQSGVYVKSQETQRSMIYLVHLPVLFDACQQGLQPANSTLAVSVQEGDDLTFGGSCSPQPGSDET